MKTREQIITSMCYTARHDYGIVKDPDYALHWTNNFHDSVSAGMYQLEREKLWKQMAQLFDNDIAPNMEFKTVVNSRNLCDTD
jgi:hypothetical protein